MTADNCVALMKVVIKRRPPLNSAVEEATKFEPVSVTVLSGSPTVAVFGLTPVSVGGGVVDGEGHRCRRTAPRVRD